MRIGAWIGAAAALGLAGVAGAMTIDFESPYTVGALASGGGSATDNPFTGQQGWSKSTDWDSGKIVTTVSSGLYVGGQALSTSAANYNYVGAKQNVDLGNAFMFDVSTALTNRPVCVGRWQDTDSDGMFDKSESGLLAGLLTAYTNGPASFGLRAANYGTQYFAPAQPVANDWYHVEVTLDDATFTATMNVTDLTTNTVVDLNGAAAGNSFSQVFSAAEYGALNSPANGVTVRIADPGSFIDNVGAVPEPTTLSLLGLGSLALLRRRRA